MELTVPQLLELLSVAANFTLMEDAAQTLGHIGFDDDQIAAFALLPEAHKIGYTARLLELAEMVREAARELDGQVLLLTGREV